MADKKVEKKTPHPRFDQLDGLRGVAILLVILNHLRLGPLFESVSPHWQTIFSLFTSSGKVAVGILFMLSGFLMASIYPRIDRPLIFYQKRYTRIFPSFITMCTALAIVRYTWKLLSAAVVPVLILFIIFAAGWLWRSLRQHPRRKVWGQWIFRLFLGFQILTIVAYLALQRFVPAAIFFQVWPPHLRALVEYFVNVTLTLPFGQYVGQLDGVYWSVITEVSLYLLYPLIFLPIFHLFRHQTTLTKIIAWLLSFPILYSVSLLAEHILGFGIMQLYSAEFFITGMVLAHFEKSTIAPPIRRGLARIPSTVAFVGSFAAVIGAPFASRYLPTQGHIDTLLWVFPTAIMFIITLQNEQLWSRWLQRRSLVFLGQMSYSLYLTHTIAIELWVKRGAPITLGEMLIDIAGAFILMAVFSYVLHQQMEKPYFVDRLKKQEEEKISSDTAQIPSSKQQSLFGYGVVTVCLFVIIWIAFHVPLSPFAIAKSYPQSLETITVLSHNSTELHFTAEQDNLGMIMLSLKPLNEQEQQRLGLVKGVESDDALLVDIYDDQQQLVNHVRFPTFQIYESAFHPIGLPIQSNSAHQTYAIELSMESSNPINHLALLSSPTNFRAVYFPNKTTFLRNPRLLTQLVLEKMIQPFRESSAQVVLLSFLPFSLLCFFVITAPKRLA